MKRESIISSLLLLLFTVSIALSIQSKYDVSTTALSISSTASRIGLIEITGPISFEMTPSPLATQGATAILEQIEALKKDTSIKGILLRINSPGGTVGASQEIYHALLDLKASQNIPIVASIADIGASGAYYIALSADRIFANPGSLVGSIGVIIGNINIAELAKKHGVYMNTHKSGPYKDILSSWRPSTDQEGRLINTLVQNVHQQFVKEVMTQRRLSSKMTRSLTQGQLYTGKMALENKLVDQLGGYNEALKEVAKTAGIKGNPIVVKKSKPRLSDLLFLWKDQLNVNWKSLFFPATIMTY